VYLCDFHREQAWERWVSATHNGVTADKREALLTALRTIAHALDEKEFEQAKRALQRWVWAFRSKRFNVNINTNNGVERQNKVLKYEYLDMKKAKSLSHLISTILLKYLPDSYRGYLQQNLNSSNEVKKYGQDVPSFLHNRPKPFIIHCMKRWQEGLMIPAGDIDDIASGTFLVKSKTQEALMYSVSFNSTDQNLPSCDCMDWRRTHWPCKHFMAIFHNIPGWDWNALPSSYKEHPTFQLDLDVVLEHQGPTSDDHTDNPSSSCSVPTCIPSERSVEELPFSTRAAVKMERTSILANN
ncbi:hypothetical protein FSP39_008463, partial [Pinctada imbricata]